METTVYKKLELAKRELHNSQLKKDKKGFNFVYMNLDTIIPIIDKICEKYDLSITTSIDYVGERQIAITKLVDLETGDFIDFKCPVDMFIESIKKHTAQNIGGNMTYYRRYMLFLVFEVVENDEVDETKGQDLETLDKKKAQQPKQQMPKNMVQDNVDRNNLYKYIANNKLDKMAVAKEFGLSQKSTPQDFKKVLETLQKRAKMSVDDMTDQELENAMNMIMGDNNE